MDNLRKSFLVKGNSIIGAVGDKYFSSTPIGVIQAFSGNTIPRGFLLCNGASYPTAEYPDLYAVIGNTYGGDSTNFNVPDYRETVLVGVGVNTTDIDAIASHDVYGLGEFKDDQFQGHWHNLGNSNGTVTVALGASIKGGSVIGANPGGEIRYTVENALDAITNGTNGEPRVGATTHGKQKGVTYIIKAFHTNEGVDSGVSDDVVEYVEGEIDALVSDEVSDSTTWSSQKTSDEIAKVETELEDYMNIKYNLLEPSTDLNTLIVAGMYMSKWGSSNSLVNKPSGFSSDYEVIVTVTPLKRIGNYGEYIEQTFVSRLPKSPVYRRIIENKAPTQPDWTELATMDKVALKQEYFNQKVTLTDSNWKYKKIPFTKSYMNTPSVNVSCGDYLNIDFYDYWGCEAYIINLNNKGCTIRYRSSKASASEPLEVNIVVFVNGI